MATNTDLAFAGHLHKTYIKTFTMEPNTFGITYQLATLQGTTPAKKYYAASPPQTQTAHPFIPFSPRHFYEKTMRGPNNHRKRKME